MMRYQYALQLISRLLNTIHFDESHDIRFLDEDDTKLYICFSAKDHKGNMGIIRRKTWNFEWSESDSDWIEQ